MSVRFISFLETNLPQPTLTVIPALSRGLGIKNHRGPWRSFEAVEDATLDWVDWFKIRQLLSLVGNIRPDAAETNFHAAFETEPIP